MSTLFHVYYITSKVDPGTFIDIICILRVNDPYSYFNMLCDLGLSRQFT